MSSPSLVATNWSFASCSPEMSKLVTLAPAAARTGACCPPPDARQSTRLPTTPSNQECGTRRFGVRMTSQLPFRALSIVDSSTGWHQGLDPLRDSASQNSLLCRWISVNRYSSAREQGDDKSPPIRDSTALVPISPCGDRYDGRAVDRLSTLRGARSRESSRQSVALNACQECLSGYFPSARNSAMDTRRSPTEAVSIAVYPSKACATAPKSGGAIPAPTVKKAMIMPKIAG